MTTLRNILIGLMILISARLSAEPIGDIISYQGKLANADGTPVANGKHSVSFKIYANGSDSGYGQTMDVNTIGGVFSAFLSVGTLSFDPTKSYELGIAADGGSETKHQIASVPVAKVAKSVPAEAIVGSEWSTYTPTIYKDDGATTMLGSIATSRYIKIGRMVVYTVYISALGDPGGISIYVTLPVAAASHGTVVGAGLGGSSTNGWKACYSEMVSPWTRAQIKQLDLTAWSASNNFISLTMTYESAN